ncbi:MAG: SMC-Scp complex subunit ScpB [Candidatus Sumerlaeia bacterium]|nr:SMC-Scp complex subunit ScpB [Candidatus Sumerlaeia bacterium]
MASDAVEEPTAHKDGEDADILDPELAIPRGEEVIAVTEALLFATTQPLSTKRLSILMNGVPVEEVSDAIGILRDRYETHQCGLMLMEIAGGWQLATRPTTSDWVLRLHKHRKKNPLTPSLMESLAIIAYKQPITRADVEAIRGVDCGNAVRALQDAGLCEVVGRKEVAGRPPLYGTTETFLKIFGLRSIDELPSAGELRAVMEAPMKESRGEQESAPSGEEAAEEAGQPAEPDPGESPAEPDDKPAPE